MGNTKITGCNDFSNHDLDDDDNNTGSNKSPRRRNKWLHFTSTLLFVIGSILYLVIAVEDYQWAKELLEYPVWLRADNDDVARMNYRLEERQNASFLEANTRSGGVKKLRTRELIWIEEERIHNAKAAKSRDHYVVEISGFTTFEPMEPMTLPGKTTNEPYERMMQQQQHPDVYDDEDWADLPPEIQEAFTIMGYDQEMWDSGGAPASDELDWDELSPEMQEAAITIGYTEEIWCGTTLEPTLEPTPVPTPIPTSKPTVKPTLPPTQPPSTPPTPLPTRPPTHPPTLAPTTRPTKEPTLNPTFEPSREPTSKSTISMTTSSSSTNPTKHPSTSLFHPSLPASTESTEEGRSFLWWHELSPELQYAYGIFGFNVTSWNSGVKLPVDYQLWDDLSPQHQAAAYFIGFRKEIWDAMIGGHFVHQQPPPGEVDSDHDTTAAKSSSPTSAPTVLPTNRPTISPTTLPSSLTSIPSSVPSTLPSTMMTSYPSSTPTDIPSLSPTHEPSLANITSNEFPPTDVATNGTSSGMNVANSDTVENVEAGYYDEFDWDELPTHIQVAASTLGYDEYLWNSGGHAWSDDYWWDELSPGNQTAASLMGYDKYSWDGIDPLTGTTIEQIDDYFSYDDDYVFQVASLDDVWVSKYQIIYFFAALSFVFVGCLDLISERRVFHVLMILAGLFGAVSSVYVEEDLHLSNVFNCVSAHFFLLEAGTLFGNNKRSGMTVEAGRWMKLSIMIGDLEFLLGSLIDVILSYFYLFDSTAEWDTVLMSFSIFGAVLWLHCSIIYLSGFFYEHCESRGRTTSKTERNEHSSDADASSADPMIAVPVFDQEITLQR